MIKISVRDVTSKGLEISQVVPKEGIGLSDEEIDLRSPLTVSANLERVGNVILAHTHVKVDQGMFCSRCLDDMHAVVEQDYEFNFAIEPGVEYIDLGEEIRQEMILANPAKVLCDKDCKGICPGCGVNLNKEQCKCSATNKKLT